MLKRVNDLTGLIKEYNGLYNEFENTIIKGLKFEK